MFARRDLAWGFAAQGLSVGLWLVMLPAVLHYLPPAQVALWIVFITLASLAQLLELGFQPTLARNVAYIFAGATSLQASGLQGTASGPLDRRLLAELLAASRLIYRVVAAAATLVLWVGGSLYVYSVVPAEEDLVRTLLAWLAFSAGSTVNFYFGYLNAFLQGRGDMRQSNQVIVVSRLVQLVLGLVLLAFDGGLLALGLAALASTVVGRWMAHRFFMRGRNDLMPGHIATRTRKLELVSTLWHNASRYGVVLVGAFLISRANILIASSRIGIVESASFALALQILLVVQSMAALPFNLVLPRLNQMRAAGDPAQREVFGRALALALLLFTLAGLGLLLLGEPLLRLMGSRTALPATGLLALLFVVMLLELNHGTCANLITTGNQVPFVKAALFTGLGITTTAWLAAPQFGVAGLIVCMGLWQLAYNNWRWPREVGRMLGVGFPRLLLGGFAALLARRSTRAG